MASRRTFLKIGLGACAAGAVIPSSVEAAVPHSCYKVVFDERFHDACAFAAAAAERGVPTVAIRGDITKLFFEDLDLRWKQGPVLLAGYTTPESIFCLDLLARDRGMRLRHCVAKPGVEAALGVLAGTLTCPLPLQSTARLPLSDSSALVFWIIAPKRRLLDAHGTR